MICGEAELFNDIAIERDAPEYLRTFSMVTESDQSLVTQCLELLLLNLSIVLNRQLKDHLRGKYSNCASNPTLIGQTQSVPVSSISAEHNFGQMDYLQKLKPNASIAAIESIILYRNNETSKLLEEQSSLKQSELLSKARKLSKTFKIRWQERYRD